MSFLYPVPPQACSILSTWWAVFFAASNLICQAQCRKSARAVSPGFSTLVLSSVARSIACATE